MAARFSLTAGIFLLSLGVSQAGWKVSSTETEAASVNGVEHRRIEVVATSGEGATIELALFSTKTATIRVLDNPGGDDLAGIARRERAIAGVNGGYFDPENAPVGLLVADGKLVAPLRKARLLSGVLVVTKARIELIRPGEYSSRKNVLAALQCGPFLVDGGKAVPGLNNLKSARRTFVLTTGTDRAAIGFCSSVTLAELGEILSAPILKTNRALNLDGGSSSAFWFTGARGVTAIAEQKTVRDFVVIAPK